METHKKVVVSSCCDSLVHFVPPSLGDVGMYFCSACNKFCETKIKNVQTHFETQKGVFRKIKNNENE
jgi:hypothetical protein